MHRKRLRKCFGGRKLVQTRLKIHSKLQFDTVIFHLLINFDIVTVKIPRLKSIHSQMKNVVRTTSSFWNPIKNKINNNKIKIARSFKNISPMKKGSNPNCMALEHFWSLGGSWSSHFGQDWGSLCFYFPTKPLHQIYYHC